MHFLMIMGVKYWRGITEEDLGFLLIPVLGTGIAVGALCCGVGSGPEQAYKDAATPHLVEYVEEK
jgi:hypothetical protein